MGEAQRFGRYTVTGTLGRGAMGKVYAAVDDVLGRSVAVKTLHGGASGLAARMLDDRFRMEARAIAALNHPGIVQVYDIDLAAEPPYLVMERMAGPSLKEQFEKGPLPANELRALGIQIARALAAAHAAGIVHRDVKPANVLVAGPGAWKLADFGVAHVPDSSLTMTGQFIGSPAYAPPEALLRGQSSAAGDVFGLGATLYYGAAGRWPRAEATTAGLLAPVPTLRELAPHLPDDLIATIDQAVHIVADQRPTAAELAEALAGASPRRSTPAIETQFVPDATSDGSRAPVLTALPAANQTAVLSAPPAIHTSFVPDATHGARPAVTAAPSANQVQTAFVPDSTAFVPDATHGARPPVVSAPPATNQLQTAFVPDATAFVPDATSGASPRASTPAPTAARRWIPWAIGGGLLALAIVIAAATMGGSKPADLANATAPPLTADATTVDPATVDPATAPFPAAEPDESGELELPPPGQIRAIPPPFPDRKAHDDWEKVVHALYEKRFGKAYQRLGDWEERWGQSRETRSLRKQLDRLSPEMLGDD